MNTAFLTTALIVTTALFQPAFAQQPAAPPTAPEPQTAPAPAEVDAQVAKIQSLMAQMNEQMSKLRQATDPAERQKLMQEHWATMQSAMTLMHETWGGTGGRMMGPMMGWREFSNMTPEQRTQREYMMQRWMPMQQMMMGDMMQHQGMMQSPPKPTE